MLHIDGSYMEGGGQIIRTALALSVFTRRPFRAEKIRHHRPKAGLKNQHLCCINALEQLSGAQVEGAHLGSFALSFIPGDVVPRTLSLDIGTAGSIPLLLQSLLLPCMFADGTVRLKIKGGTDTKWSIPIDYFTNLILPFYMDFASIAVKEIRRGYYPKGQGLVDLTVRPDHHKSEFESTEGFLVYLRTKIPPIRLAARSRLLSIKGISSGSHHLKSARVAERQTRGATRIINGLYPVDILEEYRKTASAGTVITLWAVPQKGKILIGADALGERGKRAEAVGADAANKLLDNLNSGTVVDSHLADNIIPLLALVGGILKINDITGHILSNIYVCEKFLDVRFHVDKREKRIEVRF